MFTFCRYKKQFAIYKDGNDYECILLPEEPTLKMTMALWDITPKEPIYTHPQKRDPVKDIRVFYNGINTSVMNVMSLDGSKRYSPTELDILQLKDEDQEMVKIMITENDGDYVIYPISSIWII